MKTEVSVILPIYNEERYIREIFDSILDFSLKNKDYQFILVDDGSPDKTPLILKQKMKQAKPKRISLISCKVNQGKGNAIKTGTKYVKGEYICFTDGDLAYSLDQLHFLTEELKKSDVVIGSRPLLREENIKNISLVRKIFGRSFNFFLKLILQLNFTDTQAGIKGFTKKAADYIFKRQKIKGFGVDAELLYLANKGSFSTAEIPVKVSKKHLTQVSSVNLIKDSTKMFLNLIKIRLNNLTGKYG